MMALSFKHYLDFVAKLSKQTELSYRPPLADGMKPFLGAEFCNKNYLGGGQLELCFKSSVR